MEQVVDVRNVWHDLGMVDRVKLLVLAPIVLLSNIIHLRHELTSAFLAIPRHFRSLVYHVCNLLFVLSYHLLSLGIVDAILISRLLYKANLSTAFLVALVNGHHVRLIPHPILHFFPFHCVLLVQHVFVLLDLLLVFHVHYSYLFQIFGQGSLHLLGLYIFLKILK